MAQFGQSLGMSKKPTSYLDVIKQKEQEKPKFNLFDFSSVKTQQPTQTPQMNFGQPVSQRNVTNFNDYKQTIPQQTQTQPTQKSGFSLIHTANAEEKDLIQTFLDDNNVNVENRKTVFEMLKDNVPKNVIEDAIINKAGYKGTQPQDFSAEENLLKNLGERYKQFTTAKDEGPLRTLTKGALPFDLQKTGALGKAFGDILGYGLEKSLSPEMKQTIVDTIGEDNLKKLDKLGQVIKSQEQSIKKVPGGTEALDIAGNVLATTDLLGAGATGKGLVTGGAKVLTKGGKVLSKGVGKITPDLSKTASTVSTKANRFNAVDEEKFIKTTGQTPGEFAVQRGMTDVGDKAVEKATQNYLTSMKQADDAFENVGGNFKYTGKGNDPIKLSLDDLETRGIKTEADFTPRIQELKTKYETEGLTMPEINEVKREYSRNFKYGFEDRNSEALARSTNIQNKIREWQLNKADEMGVSNIREINKNTQAWKLYADALEKKLNRSGANNAVSITDWIALSGGNATNVALFLGKKLGTSDKAKELLIKTLGKKTKEAIISPDINKPQIKGLLPKGPVITPQPEFKSGIKVTPAIIQPNIKTQKALPSGKVVTPQTSEKGIIQESKIPLKKTKTSLNTTSEGAQNYDLAKQSIKDYDNVKDLEELRGDIKTLGLAREKELLQELDNKILGLKEMEIIESSIGDKLYTEYGDDLINNFKVLYKNEIRNKTRGGADKYSKVEFQNTPGFIKFKDSVNEYIGKNPWNDKTTQEIYDDIKDQLTNISVKEIKKTILSSNKPKYGTNNNIPSNMTNTRTETILKPNQPTNVSNKPLKPFNKSETKKKLQTLTKDNVDDIAKSITTDKTKLSQVKAVIQKYLKEYGDNIKNYLGLLVDDIADIVGGRAKLLGGEKAKLFDKSRWQQAKEMTNAGKSADDIWKETGWEKGTDGKWRFEIDDSKAKLKDGLDLDYKKTKEYLLKDVLEHDDLFKQYPNLKEVKIIDDPKYDGMGEFTPGIDSDNFFRNPSIKLNIIKMLDDGDSPKSTLLHEIQHYIQSKEGFAKGGTISKNVNFEGNKELDDLYSTYRKYGDYLNEIKSGKEVILDKGKPYQHKLTKESIEKFRDKLELKIDNLETKLRSESESKNFSDYKNLAGETEARNVQSRLLKTPSERKLLRPAKTEDVARDKQIVKMDGGKAMSVSDDLISEARKYKSAEEFIKSQGLERIGAGRGRQVYDLGDGNVIKVTIDLKGKVQNIDEMKMQDYGFIPKIKAKGDDYIIMEKVNTPGYDNKKIEDVVRFFRKTNYDATNSELNNILYEAEKKFGLKGLSDFDAKDILFDDLMNVDNWGIKDGKLKIIDGGIFGKDTLKTEAQLKQIYEQSKKTKLLKKAK